MNPTTYKLALVFVWFLRGLVPSGTTSIAAVEAIEKWKAETSAILASKSPRKIVLYTGSDRGGDLSIWERRNLKRMIINIGLSTKDRVWEFWSEGDSLLLAFQAHQGYPADSDGNHDFTKPLALQVEKKLYFDKATGRAVAEYKGFQRCSIDGADEQQLLRLYRVAAAMAATSASSAEFNISLTTTKPAGGAK